MWAGTKMKDQIPTGQMPGKHRPKDSAVNRAQKKGSTALFSITRRKPPCVYAFLTTLLTSTTAFLKFWILILWKADYLSFFIGLHRKN